MKFLILLSLFLLPITLSAQLETEPNGSFNDANEIGFDTTITAFINQVEDKDYFKFEISEPSQIHIEVMEVPVNIELENVLYDTNFKVIWADYTKSDGETYDIWFTTCNTGTFYLSFRDGAPLTHAGGLDFNIEDSYSFKISATSLASIDDFECNNSFSKASLIEPCTPIYASINPWFLFIDQVVNDVVEYDIDYFKIELEAKEAVRIVVDSVPFDVAICLTIYDKWQQKLEYYSGNYGQSFDIAFSAYEEGIYYIEIQDCESNFSVDDKYTLKVGCNLISTTEEYDYDPEINIFPNPFTNFLNIQFESDYGKEMEIKIFDILGHLVHQEKTTISEHINIQTASLPQGLLILRMKIGNKVINRQILKF